MDARAFCLVSAGCFFLVGLLAGTWKYAWIVRTAHGEARAPYYVDTAHRASLLYAFACALMAQLCGESAWSDRTNLAASIVLVSLFASAVLGYVVHGALRDTDNQLRRPHRLGAGTIPAGAMLAFMVVLAAGELAAFSVLLAGTVTAGR